MHKTSLRKVGGSVMVAVPPAILEMLHVQAGSEVGMSVEGGRLVVSPSLRPRYRLEELLARCDAAAEPSAEDREWLESGPKGGELL